MKEDEGRKKERFMDRLSRLLRINNQKLLRIVVVVLTISFLSGVFAIVTRQPMSWYDEEVHYARVITLVNGDFFVVKDNNMAAVGGEISSSQNSFIDEAFSTKVFDSGHRAIDAAWLFNYDDIPYSNETLFRVVTSTIVYNPIVYLPYTIIGVITKTLHCTPVFEFFLMRTAGFVCFFFLYLYAIRKTPVGKLAFSMIGLSPPVFIGFASITADNYTVTMTAVFLAVLFESFDKLFRKQSLDKRDLGELFAASFLLVLGKMPVFLFIALLLPLAYYGYSTASINRRSLYLVLGIIGVCALVTIVWFAMIKDVNTGAFWGRNVSTTEQASYILSDVRQFAALMWTTILNFSFFTIQVGYANDSNYMALPFVPCMLFYIGLILSTGVRESDNDSMRFDGSRFSTVFNLAVIFVVATYICFVFLSLYLQFSEIGSNVIEGVQARYFIPILFLIFGNFTYSMRISEKEWPYIVFLGACPSIAYSLGVIAQLC